MVSSGGEVISGVGGEVTSGVGVAAAGGVTFRVGVILCCWGGPLCGEINILEI